MGLSKKTIVFTGLGIFAIVVALLVLDVSRKLDEQRKLEQQVATAQGRLQILQSEQLATEREQLEEQLAKVTPQYESARAIISTGVSSPNASAALFDAAKVNRLTVTELTSTSLTNEALEGVNLQSLVINANVTGNVSDMSRFVGDLNKAFVTGAVRSVSITVPEGTASQNTTANVELVVYMYQGN